MLKSTLGFYGGVGNVTGANFLLDTGGTAILVDCGLIQGDRFAMSANRESFLYNPKDIDFLFITHAHMDHIGRVPKLVREGFVGTIYSTEPTKALAEIMFEDALKIMQLEQEQYGTELLYELEDVTSALSQWNTLSYDQSVSLPEDMQARLTNAGHILGSAMVTITRNGHSVVFTGDIGNVPQPLLNPPVLPAEYDYMIMESVYGDREHEEVEERTELLRQHIEDTRRKKGTLIIPAFSLERTQGLLLEMNNLVEQGALQPLPVFLDSPLAIRVTDIYRRYPEYLKDEVQKQIKAGDDIFAFSGLSFTPSVAESHAIAGIAGPKIIIAGAGMSHGGRIREHEKRYLEEKNTTLLLVGYQSVGSLGRLLQDGAKQVKIDGMKVRVRATVARIRGYSGHADRNQLVDFVSVGGEKAKKVFVTMGEERSSLFLVQRLRDYLGANAVAPSLHEEVVIDF